MYRGSTFWNQAPEWWTDIEGLGISILIDRPVQDLQILHQIDCSQNVSGWIPLSPRFFTRLIAYKMPQGESHCLPDYSPDWLLTKCHNQNPIVGTWWIFVSSSREVKTSLSWDVGPSITLQYCESFKDTRHSSVLNRLFLPYLHLNLSCQEFKGALPGLFGSWNISKFSC